MCDPRTKRIHALITEEMEQDFTESKSEQVVSVDDAVCVDLWNNYREWASEQETQPVSAEDADDVWISNPLEMYLSMRLADLEAEFKKTGEKSIYFDMSQIDIGLPGIRKNFADFISGHSIQELDLGGSEVFDHDENRALIEAVSKSTTINKLVIPALSDDKAAHFFDAITRNTTLLSLCVTMGYLSDDYFTQVSIALAVNSTLLRLDLSALSLSKENVEILSGGLGENIGLTELSLGSLREEKHGDKTESMAIIMRALAGNPNSALVSLSFQEYLNSKETKEVCASLSPLLQTNRTLCYFKPTLEAKLPVRRGLFDGTQRVWSIHQQEIDLVNTLLERNQQIKKKVDHNWQPLVVMTAFMRANYDNELRYSILPLIKYMIMPFVGDNAMTPPLSEMRIRSRR